MAISFLVFDFNFNLNLDCRPSLYWIYPQKLCLGMFSSMGMFYNFRFIFFLPFFLHYFIKCNAYWIAIHCHSNQTENTLIPHFHNSYSGLQLFLLLPFVIFFSNFFSIAKKKKFNKLKANHVIASVGAVDNLLRLNEKPTDANTQSPHFDSNVPGFVEFFLWFKYNRKEWKKKYCINYEWNLVGLFDMRKL